MSDLPPDVSFTDWASCPQQVPLVMMRPVQSMIVSKVNDNTNDDDGDKHVFVLVFAAAVPDAPRHLRAIARSPTSILVSWDSPSVSDTAVLGYAVYYYDVGSSETQEAELNVTSNTCTLVDLRKYHQYSVRVVAYGANGRGASTPEVYCRTLSDG